MRIEYVHTYNLLFYMHVHIHVAIATETYIHLCMYVKITCDIHLLCISIHHCYNYIIIMSRTGNVNAGAQEALHN